MFAAKNLAVWVLLGMLLAVGPTPLRAQRSDRANQPAAYLQLDEGIGEFLAQVSQGQVQRAYDKLLARSLIADDSEQVAGLVEKTENALVTLAAYGPFVGAEHVATRSAGESLVHLRYLYKAQRLPMVWYFTYYRPRSDGEWTLVAVRFDTELEKVFEE